MLVYLTPNLVRNIFGGQVDVTVSVGDCGKRGCSIARRKLLYLRKRLLMTTSYHENTSISSIRI